MIEVEAVQAEPGDSGSIYLGKSLFAFTEGRPARLNISRARGQHSIELRSRQRLAWACRCVLARKGVEWQLEFGMHQFRPVVVEPCQELLEGRPARVSRCHSMWLTVEPRDKLAHQRSIDLTQRLYLPCPALTLRKKTQPVTDA